MMIKDTATLRKHISVNGSVTIENVQPYLKKASRSFLKPHIGTAQLAIFEAAQTDTVIQSAQELAQEAVANFGYYLYLPIGAVKISDAGISVAESTHSRPASDKQFKELQRSFKTSAHEALDELLVLMEETPARFEPWVSSKHYTHYKELLVHNTATFNEEYFIFNSRLTFIALRPTIKIVEEQFIVGAVGSTLLAALKVTQTETERKQVKKYLQKSIVAFTIMKTVYNGMFALDAQGMHMRFDVLPYEKVATNVNLKVNDFLVHTTKSKQVEGEQFLKMALEIIVANPLKFTEYTVVVVDAPKLIIETQGIVGM